MKARHSLRKALFLRATWVLASTVLVLLLFVSVEGVLRLAGIPEDRASQGVPSWVDDEHLALLQDWTRKTGVGMADLGDLPGWRWDPELRWSLRPDVRLDVRNIFLEAETHWQFSTNSRGFRTPEFEPASGEGTARVVVIGDSNSLGWLLNDDETYARRLELHLAERLGHPVEVINLGMPGYTSYSCRRIFEQVALALKPDALIFSFGANDNQRMTTSDVDYTASWSGPAPGFRFWIGRLRLTRVLRGMLAPAERELVQRVTPGEYAGNLTAMLEQAEERGIPAVFLQVCCCRPDYLAELTLVAERFRMPVLDADAALEAFSAPEVRRRHAEQFNRVAGWYATDRIKDDLSLLFLFRDRCHLNPLGADLVAVALADELAGRLRM